MHIEKGVFMRKRLTGLLAAFTAAAVTAASFSAQTAGISGTAKTLSEIETEKKQMQAEIDKKKNELAQIADDIGKKSQYEQTLREQVGLISDKMTLIDTQLTNLHREMTDTELDIQALKKEITGNQAEVEKDTDLFKKRLRAMYIHGNDSLLSALVGASNFYEVLTKMDLIERISKHDNDIILNLRTAIQTLKENEQKLTEKKQALNLQKTEMDVLHDEFQKNRKELDTAISDNHANIVWLTEQQDQTQTELGKQQAAMEEISEEERQLLMEEIRKAEEEQRQRELAAAAMTTTTVQTTVPVTTTVTTAAPAPAAQQTPVTAAPAPVVTAAPTTAPPPVTQTPAPSATYNGGKMAWPVPGYYGISSPFGMRLDPFGSGRMTGHSGIDIIGTVSAINGAAACAAAPGTVILSFNGGYGNGYGNYVVIDHGNGYKTLYAHLQRTTVTVGQYVNTGDQIGVVGSTGNSTGPHLHFEVQVNGVPQNPVNYLP